MQNVSTLMDGELNVDEAKREVARLKADLTLRDTWDTYHLIGDAMRGSAIGAPGFTARLSERLGAEPTVLAPHASVTSRSARKIQTYALSAAASVAAVAVVGWVALTTTAVQPNAPGGALAKAPATQSQPQVAVLPPNVTVPQPDVPQVAAAPAERMQEYLLAHQGISPTTAIQGVTPYIRTVSSSED
ncbi:MAG TPA: sigma-E factor negative regulatory protein [Burkholderiales bacterium]|nr:sigma-E factor negative regulatory protein [Burkholderiales bacterium]